MTASPHVHAPRAGIAGGFRLTVTYPGVDENQRRRNLARNRAMYVLQWLLLLGPPAALATLGPPPFLGWPAALITIAVAQVMALALAGAFMVPRIPVPLELAPDLAWVSGARGQAAARAHRLVWDAARLWPIYVRTRTGFIIQTPIGQHVRTVLGDVLRELAELESCVLADRLTLSENLKEQLI